MGEQPGQAPRRKTTATYDVVVVGAGFAGLYMLNRLRQLGLSARVFERDAGVGGTWYWNRYPGARCDVESMQYSYSFSDELQQDWHWTERYPSQAEILRYIDHVADRFDLRRDIQIETSVTMAAYDEAAKLWQVETDRGDAVTARFYIMATGALSAARKPDISGLDSFRGKWYHTGVWPHEEVDFTRQRVAVIGTGSSGIQTIPVVSEQAARLYVLQRTPNFSIPAWNAPLPQDQQAAWKANYAEHRARVRDTRSGILYELRVQPARRVRRVQGGAPRGVRAAVGEGRRELHARVQRHLREPHRQRRGRGLRARAHPLDRPRPGRRRDARAEGPSDRHQADLRRHRLL